MPPEQIGALSVIIRTLNEHDEINLTEEDKLCIRELEQRLADNRALEASLRANTRENARLTFDHVVNDLLQDMVDGHVRFYKQVTDDPRFAHAFNDLLFDRYVEGIERVDDILSQVPRDNQVMSTIDRAAAVLERAGMTVDDLLDDLPAIRNEVVREMYGDEFMDELGRQFAALHHGNVGRDADA